MNMLEESDRLLKGWTVEILATDLNDRSVETAKAGVTATMRCARPGTLQTQILRSGRREETGGPSGSKKIKSPSAA